MKKFYYRFNADTMGMDTIMEICAYARISAAVCNYIQRDAHGEYYYGQFDADCMEEDTGYGVLDFVARNSDSGYSVGSFPVIDDMKEDMRREGVHAEFADLMKRFPDF